MKFTLKIFLNFTLCACVGLEDGFPVTGHL